MKKPLIGITLDEEDTQTYSKYPWYAARKNYSESIEKAGGVSIFLPSNSQEIEYYLKLVDGLVITGGDFDIDPSLYGESNICKEIKTKKNRTNFEFSITEAAISEKKPLLGICGGQQLINVVLGGTLIQHIPDYINNNLIKHEQPNPRDEPSHYVKIEKNTKLYKITNSAKMFVNSAHHQAVKTLGRNLVANSYSEDGIIEGIEAIDHPFCLGIQWHPEFLIDKCDIKIFQSFVEISTR